MSKPSARIDLCNRCGYCQAVCPVFRETGLERTTGRGRVSLLRRAREGALPFDRGLMDVLYDCTLCGRCAEVCPSGIDVPSLVLSGRERMASESGRPVLAPRLMNAVLPRPGLLGYAGAALRVYQSSGLRKLVRRTGLMAGAEAMLPGQIAGPYRSRPDHGTGRPAGTVYFLGCATNLFHPHVARATMRVLERTGGARLAADGCCGLPALVYGNRELALALARRAVDALWGAGTVVTDCASCASMLKSYGELLSGDGEYAERAVEVAGRVRGLSEHLAEVGYGGRVAGGPLAVHYPCHMVRYQETAGHLKELLSGLCPEVREGDDPGACCGAAGTYALTHKALSDRILGRRTDDLLATGASAVVTECPACMTQLRRGLNGRLRVLHVAEIMAPDE